MSIYSFKQLAVQLTGLLSIALAVHGQTPAPAGRGIEAIALRTEHLAEPLGVDTPAPRFSWKLQSAQRAQMQTAYRVIVASTQKLAAAGHGDVWDSEKVASDRTVEIDYAGKPLQSATRYYWRVKTWDKKAKESSWNDVTWFETGLYNASNWTAKWIGANVPADPLPMLRKTFTVNKPVASARLYICGLGYYEARLNGKKIGNRLLEAPDTQHDKRNYYTTFDVTSQLRAGKNALGVELGRAFYDLAEGNSWGWNSAGWRDHVKFIGQLELVNTDGSRQTVISDETWKVYLDGPWRHNSIYYGDDYDARKEVAGWDTPGYDDSGWSPAVVVQAPSSKGLPPAQLKSHMMPPIRVIATKKPVAITEPKPGVFVYDVGEVNAGWITLSASAPAGTKITLRYHEKLEKDGTIAPYPAKPPLYQTYTYTFKGQGVESFEPKFSYNGFKYVQVMDFPGKLTLDNAEVKLVHQDVPVIGKFTCSNPLINRLHANQVHTMLNNFHNKPTDTPMYEKNGWTGDFNFACRSALYNFEMTPFLEKWINDAQDNQRDSGSVTFRVPCAHISDGFGPAWTAFYLQVPWKMYLYSGDRRVLEEHYEGFKKHGDYLWSKLDENKLAPAKTFGPDWQCPHNENPPEGSQMAASAHVYGYLTTLAEVAKLLGKDADAAEYSGRAKIMKDAMNTLCYDPATKSYKTDIPTPFRQTTNLLPFGFGFIPEDRKADVSANLAKDVTEVRAGRLETGCIGTEHLLPVLTDNGFGEVAYTVINQKGWPGWGYFDESGSGANWESFRTSARSLSHYWLGTYEEWLYSHLAGIKPTAPGFKEISIKPYPLGDLTYVSAEVETVRGLVASSWKKNEAGLSMKVTIPPNATATVSVPTSDAKSVKEGGVDAAKAKGVKHLRDEKGYAVYSVGSGTYEFTASK
jgi:alpha-L-rhamnosidase